MKRLFRTYGPPAALIIIAAGLWVTPRVASISPSTLILALTFLAILWYTWETRKMQQAVATQSRELVNQQRLSILPNLSVGFTKQQNPIPPHEIFECLELRNIGNGPAVNIEVNPIRVNYADNAFARIRFGNFLYLEPNKENSPTQKFAHLRIFIDNEAIEPTDPADFATWLVPSEFQTSPVSFLGEYNNDPKINLLLRFENVNGLRYEQSAVMQVDKSSLRPSRLGVPKIEDSLSNNSE